MNINVWSCGVERCTVSHNDKAYFSNMLLNSMHKHYVWYSWLLCYMGTEYDASFKNDQITTDVFVLFYFALFWYKNGKKIKPDILGLWKNPRLQ